MDPRKKHPWILRVQRYALDLIDGIEEGKWRGKKVVGICWGHQTLGMLGGGEVVDCEVPELGVTSSTLTPAGLRFFSCGPRKDGTLRLQQHHRRRLGRSPRGFTELLAENQAFISHNNAILTFQGHPEKDARAAKRRIGDAARWYGTDMNDQGAVNELLRQIEAEHDGREVWERILRWVGEGVHVRESAL